MIPLFVYGASPWDKYLIPVPPATTTAWTSWFQARATAITGWTPWQDPTIGWFVGPVGAYVDTYAIYPAPDGSNPHPELTFEDALGNQLYIPYGCSGGKCPQFAGDFANENFYMLQAGGIASIMSKGYTSLFLDDVNLDVRCSDGNGNTVLPQYITPLLWAEWITRFVEKIRRAQQTALIIHNSIWFSSAPQWIIDREIKAADYINCERGFGDANLNPTTFDQFMAFIDHVHELSRNVIQDEYTKDNLSFKIACFLLVYEPGDLMCVADLFPDAWDTQMDVDFGEPMGPRYSIMPGVYHRNFSKVSVMVDFIKRTGSVASL